MNYQFPEKYSNFDNVASRTPYSRVVSLEFQKLSVQHVYERRTGDKNEHCIVTRTHLFYGDAAFATVFTIWIKTLKIVQNCVWTVKSVGKVSFLWEKKLKYIFLWQWLLSPTTQNRFSTWRRWRISRHCCLSSD